MRTCDNSVKAVTTRKMAIMYETSPTSVSINTLQEQTHSGVSQQLTTTVPERTVSGKAPESRRFSMMRCIISEKHRRIISKVVQIDGKKDVDYRKYIQENSRTYETLKNCEKVASGPHRMSYHCTQAGNFSMQAQILRMIFYSSERDQKSCELG